MVRPIELQDNFSKAPLATKVQQVQQTSPDMAHRQVAQELAREQILDHSRTRPSAESQEANMRLDDRERPRGQRRQRRPGGEAQDAGATEKEAPESTSGHLDIIA